MKSLVIGGFEAAELSVNAHIEWRGFYPVTRGCQGETAIYATQAQAITLAQSEREKARRDTFGMRKALRRLNPAPIAVIIWQNANTKIFVLISTDPAGRRSTGKIPRVGYFCRWPQAAAFRSVQKACAAKLWIDMKLLKDN